MNIDDLMIATVGAAAIVCARGMARATNVYYEKLGIDCLSLNLLKWFYRLVGLLIITVQVFA